MGSAGHGHAVLSVKKICKKGQCPRTPAGIVTNDVGMAVIAKHLEIAMIRCQPAVKDIHYMDMTVAQLEPPRRLFAAVAGVTVNPDLHLPPGNDNARFIAFLALFLFLHLPELLHHFGHFLLHGRGKGIDGFLQIVGH